MSRPRGFLPALLVLVSAAVALLVFFAPRSSNGPTAAHPATRARATTRIEPVAFTVAGSPAPARIPPAKIQPPAPTAEPEPPANARVHTAKPGEAVVTIARMYLPETPYMTTRELEAAIRRANPQLRGDFLKGGTQVAIPDIEPQPVVEKPVARAKDFEVRAIYLTGTMAGSETGMRIIERWRDVGGNAIVFDVKDSDGSVNIPFAHPLAAGGRNRPIRNLPKFVRWAHRQGMHVIARIAIFRDELLVRRHPELAVQSRRGGGAWRENGKLVWTDPSRDEVQDYNIALAQTAAAGGVDEIQYDYVRFPAEGDQADAKFAYQEAEKRTRADVITDFVARSQRELRPRGVLFSLDVFGVVAWQRPIDLAHVGQDIARLAEHCDVLSPMIYPSHFFGMDGYALPGDAPEHFIGESMARFRKVTAESGVVLRPWLQAFGWRTRTYSPAYIETQVATAKKQGGIGFLFWNARNDYSKPFTAMGTMRQAPEKFFQGEKRAATTAAGLQ
ncbi:MAG TPA: putative glycoside hydrolase [Terriglobales bacterium]|nr:putative glycoside hydrolase [Terriglobales bacterium]